MGGERLQEGEKIFEKRFLVPALPSVLEKSCKLRQTRTSNQSEGDNFKSRTCNIFCIYEFVYMKMLMKTYNIVDL